MPIWKMNFCSRFLRLSVVPRCREMPQIAMCVFGVVREIKMTSDWLRYILVILLNIAMRSRLLVSPMYNLLHNVQVMQ